jgi:hypothetical protein
MLDDLRLWLNFLEQARRIISLNILVIREPIALYRADACKDGSGELNVIPPYLQNRTTLTVLEFFASIVGPAKSRLASE